MPEFLQAPAGCVLSCGLGPRDVAEAVDLLEGGYWNQGVPREAIGRAQLGSSAWVGARDAAGRLVATARAISDGSRRAWVYDVMVAPSLRGRGVGEAVVRLLLGHPAVRGVSHVHLGTQDAHTFYARFGFRDRAALPPRPFTSTGDAARQGVKRRPGVDAAPAPLHGGGPAKHMAHPTPFSSAGRLVPPIGMALTTEEGCPQGNPR